MRVPLRSLFSPNFNIAESAQYIHSMPVHHLISNDTQELCLTKKPRSGSLLRRKSSSACCIFTMANAYIRSVFHTDTLMVQYYAALIPNIGFVYI